MSPAVGFGQTRQRAMDMSTRIVANCRVEGLRRAEDAVLEACVAIRRPVGGPAPTCLANAELALLGRGLLSCTPSVQEGCLPLHRLCAFVDRAVAVRTFVDRPSSRSQAYDGRVLDARTRTPRPGSRRVCSCTARR